jgi:hypothetical protein
MAAVVMTAVVVRSEDCDTVEEVGKVVRGRRRRWVNWRQP